MVEKNYHQAYVQPHCDLCAQDLDSPDLYIRVETAYRDSTKTAVHKGHLCEECNEYDDGYPSQKAEQIEFHFIQNEDRIAELQMVDVYGRHRVNGNLESVWKYGANEVPEFLRIYGHMIVREGAGNADSDWDHPRIDELSQQYAKALERI